MIALLAFGILLILAGCAGERLIVGARGKVPMEPGPGGSLALPVDDPLIVNYPDHDLSDGSVRDYAGGTWAYDGHGGTDFAIVNFPQMDAGVPVFAAAAGVVIEAHDGEPDRNTAGGTGSGNYVLIRHEGGTKTKYAHLRKWSIAVTAGDEVAAGQSIGYVGSSGNSTGPHLDFRVYGDEGGLLDPFCAALWISPPPYAAFGLRVLEGDVTDHVPTYREILERPAHVGAFDDGDSAVVFWSQFAGTVGWEDPLTHRLYRPGGAIHRTRDVPNGPYRFSWRYWRWSLAGLREWPGLWRATIETADGPQVDVSFTVN